jgi:non-specific serine/threonine protein kinase
LCFKRENGSAEPAASGVGWEEELFELGARRVKSDSDVVTFWTNFSAAYIQHLCRLADDESPLKQPPVGKGTLERMIFSAPPMEGGEYLTVDCLFSIWTNLAIWVATRLVGKTITEFFQARAPMWRRVGRLTFHLAENPDNPERPFAFMVTFVPSLTIEGRDRHAPIVNAIKYYSKKKDKTPFVRLLTPIKAAAERLPWVRELDESGGLYRPLSLNIDQAYRFLKDEAVLEDCGLTVRVPEWWKRKPRVRVKVVVGETNVPALGLQSILDWNVKVAVGEDNLTPDEIAELLNGPYTGGLVYFKGQWLEADREELGKALGKWRGAFEAEGDRGMTFIRAMRLLSGYSADGDATLPGPGPWVTAEAGKALKNVFNQLRDPKSSVPPEKLTAELRPYQQEGLTWLSILTGMGLGGCLADDMGLGKTVQVLALLLLDIDRRGADKNNPALPSLLVVPASLLANWRVEAERFAPTLRLKIFHPSESSREKLSLWEKDPAALAEDADLVVTSYAYFQRRHDLFERMNFGMAILDEAQAIKNPQTNQSKAVRGINARARLILTGTPIENRLTDLWSLFDFINPGLLGTRTRFLEIVQELEKRKEDQYGPLRRLIAPYLLRRLKTDRRVINDLPDKVETSLFCRLTPEQASEYQKITDGLAASLKAFSDPRNPSVKNKRKGLVLRSLTRLKQLMNHPAHLTGDGDWSEERSGKFLRLRELCQELAERQEKILVFTQYAEIIEPLMGHLEKIFGKPGLDFHGGTPVKNRQKIVDAFQSPDGPPFLVLSLKAGGTGINLTAAGQVIHFDRWWNPAVEDQATDRAYRIGQKKNVLVHKCVTRGTLEEKIDSLLTGKRELAAEVLHTGEEISLLSLDDNELLNLVTLDPDRALMPN